MIHLFINAFAASAGGGLTYVRNVVPQFARREDVRVSVLLSPALRGQLANYRNVALIERVPPGGVASRFWFEQRHLPGLIRQVCADVLLSAGNFALWNSPVPQILLSRNALYTSPDFLRDLRRRGDYSLWLGTKLKAEFARGSIQRADATVAPSRAFANELRDWTGVDVTVIHHGFDPEAFFGNPTPLRAEIQRKLDATRGALRLLFVSDYTYYRNFETLIRAIPLLRAAISPRKIRLILTCELFRKGNSGTYHSDFAASLVRQLRMSEEVVELGPVPYWSLHHIYRACDIYVSPAYAETFAHPLVEAMSSGLPIVASDLPVHREICETAGLYFPRFSENELAERVMKVASSRELAAEMIASGKARSKAFDWSAHVNQILSLAADLMAERSSPRS